MTTLDFDPQAVVAAAVKKGWCSVPEFTPPRSNAEIRVMRCHLNGLTQRGTVPLAPSLVPGVPRNIVNLVQSFARQFTEPFEVLDFQLFLAREKIELQTTTIRLYLNRLAAAGYLTSLTHGQSGVRAKFEIARNYERQTH